ncbi:S8 family peptidase [Xanthomonas sp. WHRI 6108]
MATDIRPVLNPVLTLKRDPRRATVTGRSPTEAHIKSDRLDQQRIVLGEQFEEISRRTTGIHAGRSLVAVKMFDDSLAPSHEPDALFRADLGSQLVAPFRGGYLAEVDLNASEAISTIVKTSARTDVRIAVSRISSVTSLGDSDVLGGRTTNSIWDVATQIDSGRLFTVWLAPFFEAEARTSVVASITKLQEDNLISGINDLVGITREPGSDADQLQIQTANSANSLARATREYRQNPFTRLNIAARDVNSLNALIASGSVFRIDPIRQIQATQAPTAPDPERPIPDEQWQPIVGVIDGGLFANSYKPMVAWEAPSLVADVSANRAHGNRIASLVVHGSAWNTHLKIPDLVCRLGIAQAIATSDPGSPARLAFQSYLRSVIARHHGDTKVWNLSFNEPVEPGSPHEMSVLGHDIHKIAREYGILPVISVGNVDHCSELRPCPPADCEAALTVGGRIAEADLPGTACPACLGGPGPEGLMKPELSWFSTLRGLGGNQLTGSSFATALVSSLAAHTFHNLKAPTPDLVRALLINTADRNAYEPRLGWGSPCMSHDVPWKCNDDSVTLLWTSELKAGQWYYWEDIPIPPQLIFNGKLKGRVCLTAILTPKVSELGAANYFSTRLQVALQYTTAKGKMGNLAGSMKEDTDPELKARSEHAKWNPVRHHAENIPTGKSFSGTTMRVCARIFARDLYQFGITNNMEIEASQVAFVLTLTGTTGQDGSIYDSVATSLGNYVESAVNDVEVSIQTE